MSCAPPPPLPHPPHPQAQWCRASRWIAPPAGTCTTSPANDPGSCPVCIQCVRSACRSCTSPVPSTSSSRARPAAVRLSCSQITAWPHSPSTPASWAVCHPILGGQCNGVGMPTAAATRRCASTANRPAPATSPTRSPPAASCNPPGGAVRACCPQALRPSPNANVSLDLISTGGCCLDCNKSEMDTLCKKAKSNVLSE